jgi:hypothetical protein
LVAGILGALVGLRFVPGLTWFERVTNLGAGGVIAYYAAPALAGWWGLSEHMVGFMSFILGMFGLSVAAAIFQGVRTLNVAEIISGWISRR